MKQAEDIKGFNKMLEGNQKLFRQFWNNFINAHGLDARENIKPVSVKFCKDSSGSYLRFDYKYYGSSEWLHVKGPHTWY